MYYVVGVLWIMIVLGLGWLTRGPWLLMVFFATATIGLGIIAHDVIRLLCYYWRNR